MCGRFTLHHSTEEIAQRFAVQKVLFEADARYNVSPGQNIAAITASGPQSRRELDGFKWGLVPFWAKDPSLGHKMINARAEGLAEKPAFKYALKQRRCLIPADGFYEWKEDGHTSAKKTARQPMHIRMKDSSLFAFAGLWEEWRPKDDKDAPPLRTCTIITTTPNSLLATFHHRMAVILRPEDEAQWLDPNLEAEDAMQLLQPYPEENMEAYAISTKVNSVAFDDCECIAPLVDEHGEMQASLFD